MADARKMLKDREETSLDFIHYIKAADRIPEDEISRNIQDWCKKQKLDAVVWTGLTAKFRNRNQKPTEDQVIDYLHGTKGEARTKAEEYVRKAPTQIRTPYRKRIETELGWTPL